MRKLEDFFEVKFAKLFADKGLNFFIFLGDSKIVQAQFMPLNCK